MGANLGKDSDQNKTIYEKFLDQTINSNQIVVFSKTNCPFCTKAKSLLNTLNLSYNSIELDRNSECPESNCQPLISSLINQTRLRTVPQIFINGQFIGGFIDLEYLSKDQEKLRKILSKEK
ncbi:glutaredoxin-C4-like isoform X2 [Brachionus plicatilis]|uniref:Glutaredoxin-C4-like isoform X2 n=1 Tax=Brachionus plicatilis TaxID=10195 RepID=A0A3M7Q5I0_BRAPC|nr:glutaredoxin-C4-like isoform X2 [Brachionus plicatilis]